MACGREINGNVIAAGSLTACFALACLLFAMSPDLYYRVVDYLLPGMIRKTFVDGAFLLGGAECWRQGIDVYVSNPCDVLGRAHNYSPLWLRLWFMPGVENGTVPLAILLAACFAGSLLLLPTIKGKVDTAIFLPAVLSPAVGFALERANADLLVFCIAALLVVSMAYSLPVRLAGYGLALLGGLLKFYPMVLLIFVLRESARIAVAVGVSCATVAAVLFWVWRDELAKMAQMIPVVPFSALGIGGSHLSVGIMSLVVWGSTHAPEALRSPLQTVSNDTKSATVLYLVLLCAAVLAAWRLSRSQGLSLAIERMTAHERWSLAAGAALYCGCFMTGSNVTYREVLLLLTLPALLAFRKDARLMRPLRWTVFAVVFLVWATLPGRMIENAYGHLWSGGGAPQVFAFWLGCQLLWWWLFTIFSASLLIVFWPRMIVLAGELGLMRARTTATP